MATSPGLARTDIERTIRKIRSRIIPFIFILYIVAFIDRMNIGFAALTMNRALRLPASSSDS
jgi:ACS family tartrate transporter-like MFS transporter